MSLNAIEWSEAQDLLVKEDFQELPVEKTAKALIRPVQRVIGKLASSSYIQGSQMAPLKGVFQELKPSLDQIVEEISAISGALLTPNLKRNILVRKKKKKEFPSKNKNLGFATF